MSDATCRLQIICKDTQPGDVVALVGGSQALGAWQTSSALKLGTTPETFPVWAGKVPVLEDRTEFKAVVLKAGGDVRWEAIEGNRHWPVGVLEGSIVRMYFGEPAEIVEDPIVPSQSTIMRDVPGAQSVGEKSSVRVASFDSSPTKSTGSSPKTPSRLRDRLLLANTRGKVEDYYLLHPQKLGEGAFGVVCKARPKSASGLTELEYTFAVKTVRIKELKDTEAFAKEIELSRLMDHPNLIKLFHSFETPDCVYLVQDLCDGGELFDRIVDAGHFSEHQAAVVMRQMFKAISYMHNIGIAHRDIKPENFLFKTKDPIEKAALKLIDFGLSKRFEPGIPMTSKVGTAFYVAPEVVRDPGYGPECDLWSCGTLMYCLLSGRPPFNGRTDGQIIAAACRGQYSMEGPSWICISLAAKDLIKRLLSAKPQDRPKPAEALTHEWIIQEEANHSDAIMHSDMLSNLTNWRSHGRFERAAMVCIASQMGDAEIEHLKDIFMACDTDHDGHLSLVEMRDGLLKAKLNIPVALADIMKEIDSSEGEGTTISYSEFVAATLDRRSMARRDLCWHAFRTFDADDNGHLCMSEIEAILRCHWLEGFPEAKEAAQWLKEADLDNDGKMSFDEFLRFITRK